MAISWLPISEEEEGPNSAALPPESRQFRPGDLVWGPLQGFPSWPGKVVQDGEQEGAVWVCWYGGRQLTQVLRYIGTVNVMRDSRTRIQ